MSKLFVPALALCVAMSSVTQAADIQSGLQVGEFPPAFNVRDVTGPKAGTTLCYRCAYGSRPVVSIFARKVDDNVASLVKKIDSIVAKNQDAKMAAFVVLLTDDPDAAEPQLKGVAKKTKIQHTPLTVFDGVAGPPSYKVAENADITVMMWVESDVKVNHALKQSELDEKKIASIVADTKKLLN